MKFSKKTCIKIIVFLCFFVCFLIGLDYITSYRAKCTSARVTTDNGNIIINADGATSIGLFKEAKLKEIEPGIYSIELHYSIMYGKPEYDYIIDNKDKHIKEIRHYDWDNPEIYEVVYKLEE